MSCKYFFLDTILICKPLENNLEITIVSIYFSFLCTLPKYAFSSLVTVSRSIFLVKLSEYCLFTYWTPLYKVREQGLWHLSNLINIIQTMDEGTLKTPIPQCRLYWLFLFGMVKLLCRFWMWSETECKTPAEYGPQYISTPPTPPPPHSHTLSVYNILYIGKVGRGEEVKAKVQ